MEVINTLLGYREFCSVRRLAERLNLNIDKSLLIFRTSRQKTWLIIANNKLHCILDDVNKDEPELRWSLSEKEINSDSFTVSSREKTPASEKTGIIDFEPYHKNWLFSKELLNDPFQNIIEFISFLKQAEKIELATEEIQIDSFDENQIEEIQQVIIVEKDTKLRESLKRELSDLLKVIPVEDMNKAYDLAKTFSPDIVISDFDLFKSSRKEVYETWWKDVWTSHIPLIFVSDKTSKSEWSSEKESKYDERLIDFKELKKVITSTAGLRYNISRNIHTPDFEFRIHTNSWQEDDRALVSEISNLILENLSHPEFNEKDISDFLRIDRILLHEKMRGLIGLTTQELIQSIRIRRAAEIINERHIGLTELSRFVGIKNVELLSTMFFQKFGKTPQEYNKK